MAEIDEIKEMFGPVDENMKTCESPKNELANTQSNRSVDVASSFGGAIDQDVLVVPRAKVLQFTSPEIAQDSSLRPGMIIESIGNRPLSDKFVPIKCEHVYIMFNPKQGEPGHDSSAEEGTLLWKTTTPTKEQKALCEFGPNGAKPIAMESLDFLCLFEGEALPCWLSFQKTNLTAGKKLYTQLWASAMKGVPMYGNKFYIRTRLVNTNPQRKYYEILTQRAGSCTEEEYNIAKKCLQMDSSAQ